MKMIQVLYPSTKPWVEHMYDGQLQVVDNVVEIPKGYDHWIDPLYVLGYRPLVETPAQEQKTEGVALTSQVEEGDNSPPSDDASPSIYPISKARKKKVTNASSE